MSFPNFAEISLFFLGLDPELSEFSGRTLRILLNFPNFFRIFRMSFPNFLTTFRILVYFPNLGRKWTRNRVPRFPLFSNSVCCEFDLKSFGPIWPGLDVAVNLGTSQI